MNTFKINENRINQLLDEFNEDRTILFNEIKIAKNNDKMKELKLKSLENIQRNLMSYKNILIKEKDKENNDK